jgi:hypothetical protein
MPVLFCPFQEVVKSEQDVLLVGYFSLGRDLRQEQLKVLNLELVNRDPPEDGIVILFFYSSNRLQFGNSL